MKPFLIILLFSLLAANSEAQFFKKLSKKIQDDAQWRVRTKADQQVSKAIDTLLELPDKAMDKKKAKKEAAAENEKPVGKKASTNGTTNSMSDEKDMTPKDGFVNFTLSTNRVFAGGSVTINGQSAKYKNYNQVEIAVNGPSVKDVKSVNLTSDVSEPYQRRKIFIGLVRTAKSRRIYRNRKRQRQKRRADNQANGI